MPRKTLLQPVKGFSVSSIPSLLRPRYRLKQFDEFWGVENYRTSCCKENSFTEEIKDRMAEEVPSTKGPRSFASLMNAAPNWGAMEESGLGVPQEHVMTSTLPEVCLMTVMLNTFLGSHYTQRNFTFNQSLWQLQRSGLHQHSLESRGSKFVKFCSQICGQKLFNSPS